GEGDRVPRAIPAAKELRSHFEIRGWHEAGLAESPDPHMVLVVESKGLAIRGEVKRRIPACGNGDREEMLPLPPGRLHEVNLATGRDGQGRAVGVIRQGGYHIRPRIGGLLLHAVGIPETDAPIGSTSGDGLAVGAVSHTLDLTRVAELLRTNDGNKLAWVPV